MGLSGVQGDRDGSDSRCRLASICSATRSLIDAEPDRNPCTSLVIHVLASAFAPEYPRTLSASCAHSSLNILCLTYIPRPRPSTGKQYLRVCIPSENTGWLHLPPLYAPRQSRRLTKSNLFAGQVAYDLICAMRFLRLDFSLDNSP